MSMKQLFVVNLAAHYDAKFSATMQIERVTAGECRPDRYNPIPPTLVQLPALAH